MKDIMPKCEIITSERNNFFINNKISIASSKPGSGSWTKGDIVYSSTPTSMCYGWMCIESGTPGNWIVLNNADLLPVHDTRGVNNKPKEYNVGRRTEFKSRGSINDPSGEKTYTVVDTMKGWSEVSGGSSIQMSYCADGNGTVPKLSVRSANNDAESWGSWYDLYHSGNKPTWNDINGKPSSFPVASHNHDSVYVNKIPKRIRSGSDLNTVLEGGNYVIEKGVLNAPCNYGRVVVLTWDTSVWVTQIVYSDMNNMVFTRCSTAENGKSWTAWSQVYSQNNMPEKVGQSDITIQPMRYNEINFGGSFKDNSSVFFGYRSIDGRPVPNIYVFGSDGGTATIQAGDVTIKGNRVYHLGNKPPASSVTLQDSSNLFNATDVEGAMKELFTNVDNGKSSIAQAIIAKGVSGASKNDTFTQLSDKIKQIKQFGLPSWVPQSGIWLSRMVDILPEFTRFCGSVVVDNKLYAIGGQSKTDSPKKSNNNLCYDYITNKWTVKANILVPSTLGTIGYVDGKIYYISGTRNNYSDRQESIFNNQCYDIASNSWSEKANARTRRSGSCGASIDKSIYLMYGHQYNSYSPSEDIDVYNTVTNTWSSGGTIIGHSPRFEVASVTKGSQIFFMGGRDENNKRTNKFEMYDVQTKSWTTLPNIPDAINKALVAIQGDNIYLVNGTPDTNYNSTHPTYVYNITSRTWSTKPKSNLENQNGVIGFIDNKLFVVGGIRGNVVSKEGEFLIL